MRVFLPASSSPLLLWVVSTILLSTANAAEVYKVIYSGEELDGSNGDAVIFTDQPDQAAGGSDLIVGCNNNGQCARTLLHFNVETLPDDAVITDVQMTLLQAAGEAEDPAVMLDLHQVTSPWTRTDASSPDGERDTWMDSLAGTTATEGDVTWKYSTYPSVEWTAEGGDVDTRVMSSFESVGDVGTSTPLFFPMTDVFKEVVRGWIDGSIPNYGILVKRDTEDPSDARMRIFFHEVSGNKERRSPKLLIVYTSESQPEQLDSQPSGPGIVLPGEPTPMPVTQAPTPAPKCPIGAADDDTKVLVDTSTQHATIFLDNGALSQDNGAFGVGIAHSGEVLRGLLQFSDLVTKIPPCARITCAEIILQTTGPCGPCKGEVDIEMHRITSAWTTTHTNDFLPQPQPLLYQVELQGAGANTGDVTWTHSTYNAADVAQGTLWGTPGGDVDATVISAEVGDERGQHKFPSSDGFVAAIQGFVDGTMENHGFLFKTEESEEYQAAKAAENTYQDYDTAYRLFHAEDAETEADRPILVVHYEEQECATEATPTAAPPGSSPSTASNASVTTIATTFVFAVSGLFFLLNVV